MVSKMESNTPHDARISYNYCQFGSKKSMGFRFYPMQREYIEATDTSYFEQSHTEFQCCLA